MMMNGKMMDGMMMSDMRDMGCAGISYDLETLYTGSFASMVVDSERWKQDFPYTGPEEALQACKKHMKEKDIKDTVCCFSAHYKDKTQEFYTSQIVMTSDLVEAPPLYDAETSTNVEFYATIL